MLLHETWMRRCLELARLGAATAAPNPMVGSVLVAQDRILAEGWHEAAGRPHAEAACLAEFGDDPVPQDAVLYVNLEPCAHHGRTGPCADLIIARGIKHVVIAQRDPFPAVNGNGVRRLQAAGVQVTEGVLEGEARWLNRRFLTSVCKARPYITLKWAQSQDGFLDRHPREARGSFRISAPETDVLVHRWRSEEQAIMVGSRTVLNDDPRLDARLVDGPSPLRVILDRNGIIPTESNVFKDGRPTLLFTIRPRSGIKAEQFMLDAHEDPLPRILAELDRRGIRSVLVEGGGLLLRRFIEHDLWDEVRVITGSPRCIRGTLAPPLPIHPVRSSVSGSDRLDLCINPAHQSNPENAWPW